ncbi:MAG: hypothetical protein LBR97_06610 [Dysgonamonadaceae bacterium]|nr:hypothetical protein [Dysgonamonadaceae bacterium]
MHINIGYDFGVTSQIGYSYFTKIKKPVWFTFDYSFPMGKTLFDDFKFRFGGQIEVAEYKNFIASLKLFGNYKRHETELVRITNFGIETSVLVGYYKPTWLLATELGFIKPFASNLKHSDIMKDNYPAIQNGWYASSGGYYFYGIQAGKSITKSFDISFRIGYTKANADNKDAILPYYAQIGLMKRF